MNPYVISTSVAFLIALLIGMFFYALGSVVAPFLIGVVFAYFLNPLKNKIRRYHVRNSFAAMLVTALFILVFSLFSITILPVLAKQFVLLGAKVSENSESIKVFFLESFNNIKVMYPDLGQRLEAFFTNFSGSILTFASNVLFSALDSGAAAINIIGIILISPIALFYMLQDWEKISKVMLDIIPLRFRKDAKTLMQRIDKTLSQYIKGQTYVCLTLGVFYATAFYIIGLESAIVLGMLSGLLIFIPYLGAIFSFILCILVAILQFGSLNPIGLVVVAFVIGQILESNFLTPYLIGRSIGLSPLWIIFAILAGGVLFGFVGVLIALPLTAILAVVIKFGFEKYTNSKFYKAKRG